MTDDWYSTGMVWGVLERALPGATTLTPIENPYLVELEDIINDGEM